MADLHVEIVAVERKIWSGEARMVIARTTEGELGVLPGHSPLLGQLAEGGVVRIMRDDADNADEIVVAAHGGFLSVTAEGVSVLAEVAELASDIDAGRARSAYDRTSGAGPDDEAAKAAHLRAQARLRAVGESV